MRLFLFAAIAVAPTVALDAVPLSPAAFYWLQNKTQQFLVACQLTGVGGVQLFTPDASSSYGAQWTRDFEMAVSGAPDLFKAIGANVSAAIAYTLDRVTPEGMVPDRVQSDGASEFAPGSPGTWPVTLAWDNMPYAGLLLAAYAREWGDAPFFCRYEPVIRRALAFLPTASGLAFNDPSAPNCSFGFEDTVSMPGRMLTVSLLLFDAASQVAALVRETSCGDVQFYDQLAAGVQGAVDTLYDVNGTSGLFLASDGIEDVPDVFGSAYLVTLGLSTPSRRLSVASFLASQWSNDSSSSNGERRGGSVTTTIFQEGQVRHLPYPDVWKRCWGSCPSPGTYQNGAFWATPLNWVVPALAANGYTVEAEAIASAAVASFQSGGVMEAINRDVGYAGVKDYVASATNLLGVVKPQAEFN